MQPLVADEPSWLWVHVQQPIVINIVHLVCDPVTGNRFSLIYVEQKGSPLYRDIISPVSCTIPSLMVRGPCMPVGSLAI